MTAFSGKPARYVFVLSGGRLHHKLAINYITDVLDFHAQVIKCFIADTTMRKGGRV